MSDGGGDYWEFGDEESDEYAYVGYADENKHKRLCKGQQSATSWARTSQPAPAQDEPAIGNGQSLERAAPPLPDAFRGHHCPICLESVEDSAMIESCRHLYSKSCLFEWLTISDRCPLCKVGVKRVIYDIKSPKEYKVHVHTGAAGRKAGEGRGTLEQVSSTGEDPTGGAAKAHSICNRNSAQGLEWRSLVYARGLAAEPPDPKARRPKSPAQLRPWIVREVEAAAFHGREGKGGTGDMRLVADVVEALLRDNDVDDQEGYCRIKGQLQGFLFEKTTPFLHELWCFRWSKIGMSAYDRAAVYSAR